jgi:hypothetical protein
MDITLQHFEGCPSWETTDRHLQTLIDRLDLDVEVQYQLIETPEAAAEYGFWGSPTVLIDGVDPFADPDAPIGLSCRVYRTDAGFAGSPTVDQLEEAIATQRTAG